MPASEIDEIFASKGKSSAAAPAAPSSSSSQAPEKKKKKKVKSAKRKRDPDQEPEQEPAPPKPAKRKVPETVFDPSAAVGAPPAKDGKSRRADKAAVTAPKSKKPKNREDEDRFKDSRGTGPRRKTEEGYSIFKEDELGITDQGGDTPLCPFDCQCCF